jgi:hypothetical protein
MFYLMDRRYRPLQSAPAHLSACALVCSRYHVDGLSVRLGDAGASMEGRCVGTLNKAPTSYTPTSRRHQAPSLLSPRWLVPAMPSGLSSQLRSSMRGGQCLMALRSMEIDVCRLRYKSNTKAFTLTDAHCSASLPKPSEGVLSPRPSIAKKSGVTKSSPERPSAAK